MNAKMQKRLKGLGLSDDQIEKIVTLGADTEEDLRHLTVADLEGVGLPVLKARRIVAEFNTQPAAAPTQAGPLKISIANDDPIRMRNRDILQAVASGERDDDFVSELRYRMPGRVFVRKVDDDDIDVEATMAAQDYARETGRELDTWEGQVTETLDEILDKRRQADPLSGEPLQASRAPDGVDWSRVSETNRVLAAFARLNGHLRGNEDRFTLVRELEESNPGGRWANVLALFKRAERSEPEKVATARAALIYRRSRPGSMPPFPVGTAGSGSTMPINWPSKLEHADQMRLIEELERFSIEELIEVARASRVDHENLPWRQKSSFKRELVLHHQRRSSVASLLVALNQARPEIGWAQVIGIVDEKAGVGDQVFGSKIDMSGRFDGATINIGTSITGDRK